VQPDTDIRLPVLRQQWRTVTFVHWRYDKSLLQQRVPPGLTVEEHDGSAWVTLTPLQMRDVRLPGTPPVPRLSTFPETNLRTYVRDQAGREGLWFFSLDAARAWITVGARLLLGAPYVLAGMEIERNGGICYAGTRKWPVPASYHLHIQPGGQIEPTALDLWLTHRWRAFTRHAGLLLEIPVQHEPWPLRAASVTTLEESLTTAAGLPAPGEAALVHHSEGVRDVTFGPARPVTMPSLSTKRTWGVPRRAG
jgi:uncharacterized protein YqjF (DUF2071 family)